MPTVVELRDLLKARGLDFKGNKGVLEARLAEADAADSSDATQPPPPGDAGAAVPDPSAEGEAVLPTGAEEEVAPSDEVPASPSIAAAPEAAAPAGDAAEAAPPPPTTGAGEVLPPPAADTVAGDGEAPAPPADTVARETIEKLAAYVAKNGRAFEQITRDRNPGDPRFGFLEDGGEGSAYYQHCAARETAELAAAKTDNFLSGSLDDMVAAPVMMPPGLAMDPLRPDWFYIDDAGGEQVT
jgi:hypothetical protein